MSRLQGRIWAQGAGGPLGVGWLRGAGRLRARILHFTATCAPAGTPSFHSPPNACARSSRRRRRRSSPRVRTPNRRRPRRLRRRWGRALRTRCQEERLGTRRSITSDSAMLGPEPLRRDDLARPRRPAPQRKRCGAAGAPSRPASAAHPQGLQPSAAREAWRCHPGPHLHYAKTHLGRVETGKPPPWS